MLRHLYINQTLVPILYSVFIYFATMFKSLSKICSTYVSHPFQQTCVRLGWNCLVFCTSSDEKLQQNNVKRQQSTGENTIEVCQKYFPLLSRWWPEIELVMQHVSILTVTTITTDIIIDIINHLTDSFLMWTSVFQKM